MLISIITINYNDKVGLERTIQSVQDQSFKDYEHIVIDGKSNDGSVEVIQNYSSNFSYWVSEADTGVYNAMNKGIKVAQGDYVMFLNSRDVLNTNEVLAEVAESLIEDADIYYGDVILVHENGERELRYSPETLTFNFLFIRTITHQAFFIKRSLFDQVFYYNENLKLVSDWEFIICALCKYNASYKHLSIIISQYDASGISSQPENKQLLLEERLERLNHHFPLFLGDYKNLKDLNRTLNSNRFKILLELEKSTIAKKVNSLMLRFFLILFRGKKLKDL